MNEPAITEAAVAAKLEELGLPIRPEELAPLTVGVQRVKEMSSANRAVVTDAMAPVLVVQPPRRPARGS